MFLLPNSYLCTRTIDDHNVRDGAIIFFLQATISPPALKVWSIGRIDTQFAVVLS
jgi:hypothetical protein